MIRRRSGKRNRRRYTLKPRFFIFTLATICFVLFVVLAFTSKGEGHYYPRGMNDGRRIMLAAREYINTPLVYEPSIYSGGYPPDGIGVCTDVVWKAFNGIGVSIKNLVDSDIAENPEAYYDVMPGIEPDLNFRWVPVLERFFERHAQRITTNLDNEIAWQPGDIVIFESSHVAIISDIHNIKGRPYLIQHGRDPAAEEDRIEAKKEFHISSHFRWYGALDT